MNWKSYFYFYFDFSFCFSATNYEPCNDLYQTGCNYILKINVWEFSMNCMWQLDDEYSCYYIEPWNPVHVCEEIDGNRSFAKSPPRELTLIKICSKLLDANLSQGKISSFDSLHLCQTNEQLGRWSWVKVERKDTSGTSKMVHTVCHNWTSTHQCTIHWMPDMS